MIMELYIIFFIFLTIWALFEGKDRRELADRRFKKDYKDYLSMKGDDLGQ